jgi:hypothetical protein
MIQIQKGYLDDVISHIKCVMMTKIQRGCLDDKTGYDSDSSNSNSSYNNYNKYSSLLYNLSIALEIY